MKYLNLGNINSEAPRIVVGCMRIADKTKGQVAGLIRQALDLGINYFDHADIYGGGQSEIIFSEAVKDLGISRDKLFLQSKCGIRQGWYDLSGQYILDSVDGILRRLNTDYLDVLLLHRPDALLQPEEIASAFDILERSGKVRSFGVSNCNSMQIELLSRTLDQRLIIDQMQFGVAHCGIVRAGLYANVDSEFANDRDGDILSYSRLNGITIQAWSPFQYGMFEGTFLGSEKYPELNRKLLEVSEKYDTVPAAVAAQWILRHPAGMQVITGTTDAGHLREICQAADFEITAKEWYEIYLSAGNRLM